MKTRSAPQKGAFTVSPDGVVVAPRRTAGPRAEPFCAACTAATTDESTGGTSQFNGFGSTLVAGGDPCPECDSVQARIWITALFIPIGRGARYRVVYVGHQRFGRPRTYYSRALKKPS